MDIFPVEGMQLVCLLGFEENMSRMTCRQAYSLTSEAGATKMERLYVKLDKWMSQWSVFETQTNPINLSAYLAQKVGYVYSPLIKELVQLGLKPKVSHKTAKLNSAKLRFGDKPQTTNTCSSNLHHIDHFGHFSSGIAFDSDSVLPFLLQPQTLFKHVKRYHGSGNNFAWFGFIEIMLLSYLWTKTMFHQIVTGTNQEIADYYSQRNFPRVFESVPHQYQLYGLINSFCLYALILRLFITARLIKRSIVNRNGYKEIEMTQLNGGFLASLRWPIRDWVKVCFIAFNHYKICDKDYKRKCSLEREAEKNAHLHVTPHPVENIQETGSLEFIFRENLIDFSKCYEFYGFDIEHKVPQWHYPLRNCRMDIWELSLLVWLTVLGTPAVVGSIGSMMLVDLYIELALLSEKKFDSTFMECVGELPNLLTRPSLLLRMFDVAILLVVQLPHLVEAATTYLDLITLISRIRKLNERFKVDLESCKHFALMYHSDNQQLEPANSRTDSNCSYPYSANQLELDFTCHQEHKTHIYGNMNTRQKHALNKSLKQSLNMAETISKEFISLKRTLTSYLDLLLIGSGFCLAVAASVVIGAETKLIRVISVFAISSCSGPLIISAVLCMVVESMVSTSVYVLQCASLPISNSAIRLILHHNAQFRKMLLILYRLLVNEGSYIERRVLWNLIVEVSQYEKKTDRSFGIIGQYPLTPTTLGQVRCAKVNSDPY